MLPSLKWVGSGLRIVVLQLWRRRMSRSRPRPICFLSTTFGSRGGLNLSIELIFIRAFSVFSNFIRDSCKMLVKFALRTSSGTLFLALFVSRGVYSGCVSVSLISENIILPTGFGLKICGRRSNDKSEFSSRMFLCEFKDLRYPFRRNFTFFNLIERMLSCIWDIINYNFQK